MVAVALVASAGIGAVGSYVASSQQAGAAKKAIKTQQDMYNQTRADLSPFREAGAGALPALSNLATGNPAQVRSQLEQLPGYQFALYQGLKGTQSGYAARGLGSSGAALKGAAQYATGLADQTYGEQFNRLLSLGQLGANAAANQANASVQSGANIAGSQIGLGNAQAGGAAGIAGSLSGGLNNYLGYNMLQNLIGGGGGANSGGGIGYVPVTPSVYGTF